MIHLEAVWIVLVGGLLVAVAIIAARASRRRTIALRKKSEEQLAAETHEFGGGIREQNRPVPVFIWIVVAGYFIWAVSYVIFTGGQGI
jgi:hypothetical protein